jgi:hypothetical protein
MGRGVLTDEKWHLVGPLCHPTAARLSGDNRLFLTGMLHVVLHVGYPWRQAERYRWWNSAYVRFRRRADQYVGDATLTTLEKLSLCDDWHHMIDSTSVHGHISVCIR